MQLVPLLIYYRSATGIRSSSRWHSACLRGAGHRPAFAGGPGRRPPFWHHRAGGHRAGQIPAPPVVAAVAGNLLHKVYSRPQLLAINASFAAIAIAIPATIRCHVAPVYQRSTVRISSFRTVRFRL